MKDLLSSTAGLLPLMALVFNLRGASPKLILKLGFTDEQDKVVKNGCLWSFFFFFHAFSGQSFQWSFKWQMILRVRWDAPTAILALRVKWGFVWSRYIWRGQINLISSDSWRCSFFIKTASVSIILAAWWGLIINPRPTKETGRLHPVLTFPHPGTIQALNGKV